MCFNAEISISTYIFGMLGCYILYLNNFIAEALFYFTVIQMQLIDDEESPRPHFDELDFKFIRNKRDLLNQIEDLEFKRTLKQSKKKY